MDALSQEYGTWMLWDTAVFQYLREQGSVILLGLATSDTQLFEGLRRVFPSVERVWSEKPTANHEQDLCMCVNVCTCACTLDSGLATTSKLRYAAQIPKLLVVHCTTNKIFNAI